MGLACADKMAQDLAAAIWREAKSEPVPRREWSRLLCVDDGASVDSRSEQAWERELLALLSDGYAVDPNLTWSVEPIQDSTWICGHLCGAREASEVGPLDMREICTDFNCHVSGGRWSHRHYSRRWLWLWKDVAVVPESNQSQA